VNTSNRRHATDDEQGRKGLDPGPETPDPSPMDGQIGEGATLASGEPIARAVRRVSDDIEADDDAEG
jgi:hypothetical protein